MAAVVGGLGVPEVHTAAPQGLRARMLKFNLTMCPLMSVTGSHWPYIVIEVLFIRIHTTIGYICMPVVQKISKTVSEKIGQVRIQADTAFLSTFTNPITSTNSQRVMEASHTSPYVFVAIDKFRTAHAYSNLLACDSCSPCDSYILHG